jgi:hypothetical protein
VSRSLDTPDGRLDLLLPIGFAIFGIVFTIKVASITGIIRRFGWSYTEIGIVLSATPSATSSQYSREAS